MTERPAPPVAALVPDLFFMTRIAATASALGLAVRELSAAGAEQACRSDPPALLLLDLHTPGDPAGLIRALRRESRTRGIRVVAFHAHVDRALRDAALEAGADVVLARSAFTAKLPAILAEARVPPP